MERSRKIIYKIECASQKVIIAANEYADRKDALSVEPAHIQLEDEMQKIIASCKCLASALPLMFLPNSPPFGKKTIDWLTSDEPHMCCETLDQMERLLQDSSTRSTRRVMASKDELREVVNLFDSHKRYFHLLFTQDVWNNERGAEQQRNAPQFRGDTTRGESSELGHPLRAPVQMDVDALERGGRRLVDREKQRKNEELMEGILKWLNGLNCTEKQDITSSLRQCDTCKWFFDALQYKMWRDGRRPFLWLQGKPGAGKSVLASSVIESLEARESPCDGEPFAYFYCDFGNERSTRATEAMRSILSQLLRQLLESGVDPGSCIDELTKAKERGGATLDNTKQLAGFTSQVAGLFAQQPLVIVDALDECGDPREILQALMAIKSRVRLLVTSRPLHAIMDTFSDLPSVSLDDKMDELSADIELHVTRELDARQRLKLLDIKLKAEIRSILCRKAGGMFRWVQCSIDTLERCVTRKQVRDALMNLPEGLDKTYERILRAIDISSRQGRLAQRALTWLVVALRPLYLDELMEGLTINLHTRTLDLDSQPVHHGALLDACSSLVTYVERTGLIILSHFSVKEYLMGASTLLKLSEFHVNWNLAHLHVVRSCMCYISICLKNTLVSGRGTSFHVPRVSVERRDYNTRNRGPVMLQPLRDYVLDHAPDHFNHLGSRIHFLLHDIKMLEEDIMAHSIVWDNMCQSANRILRCTAPSWPASKHDFTLYILVAFGPNSVLCKYLRRRPLEPRVSTNPLIYAAYFNKYEHAQTLLSRGARLNNSGWEVDKGCQALPIEVAFQNHHYAIMSFFLAEGSPVPMHTFTMLYHDKDYAKLPSSIVKILLQTDDLMEAAQSSLTKAFLEPLALFKCFMNNDIDEQDLVVIMQRIVQIGYDLSSNGAALVYIAAMRGYVATMHYLLSLGLPLPSDLLVKLNMGCSENAVGMIRYLVESGVNINARDRLGNSPLHISLATLKEPEALESARLLVTHGCDPLKANRYGKTPLHNAVGLAYISIVEFFLSCGVELPPDLLIASPLRPTQKSAQMIHYLVNRGANVLARTRYGSSILHIVLSCFNEQDALETAKLLVNRRRELLEANSYGLNPLHIAIDRRHVSVARYLVSVGAPLSEIGTLLPSLSQSTQENAQTIRFLAENGANVLTCTESNDSFLHMTMDPLHEEETLKTVKLLVRRGCNLRQTNSRGATPLHIAVESGCVSVVQYLLSLRTHPPSDLLASLCSRKSKNRASMLRHLVQSGLIVPTHISDGDPLLHTVLASFSEQEALEAAKFLIARGCDPFTGNSYRDSPLRIALERSHSSVVHYLLSLGAPLPSDILIALPFWAMKNCAEVIRDLVQRGANVDARYSDGDSLLHMSSLRCLEREALETAKLLISYGYDPLEANSRGKTPLRISIEEGHVSVARYLLSIGVPLPPDLLTMSGSWQRLEGARMTRFLAENGFDVHSRNERGESLLHIVIQYFPEGEALETTKFLLGLGSPIDAENSCGETPLHFAIQRGHLFLVYYLLSISATLPCNALSTALLSELLAEDLQKKMEMVQFLINEGAVLASPSSGNTVLHNAIVAFPGGTPEVLELISTLVARGCDLATPNDDGVTPLHLAVEHCDVSIVKHLLSLKAPLPRDILFAATEHCFTPQRIKIIDVLVTSGCDTMIRNEDGRTPLHVAVIHGNVAAVNYLLKAMDNPLTEDLLSVVTQAPRQVQDEMTTLLNARLTRPERSADGPSELRPTKRTRVS